VRKKPYFAQTALCGPAGHKAKYFDKIEDARVWLSDNGGGSIKKRNAATVYASGFGLGRVEYDPPLRVWGVVEEVG
jgi:hypothetical protein